MKLSLGEIDETGYLVLGVVALIIVYELLAPDDGQGPNKIQKLFGFPDPNDNVGNPNSVGDTSSSVYAGNGVLGWVGNVTNQLLGGIPQSLGTALGGAAADATGN